MSLKLILFDIGGVLIEYGSFFVTVSKEQPIPHALMDAQFTKFDERITTGDITPQELYVSCIKDNKLKADLDYDFADSWIRDYEVIRPTFELLLKLSQKYQIGLLSNIYKGLVPKMIEMNILPRISYKYMFLSCDLGMKKPDPEIYDHIQKATRLQAGEILFIDDVAANLVIPSEMKWQTFQFPRQNPVSGVSDLRKLLF